MSSRTQTSPIRVLKETDVWHFGYPVPSGIAGVSPNLPSQASPTSHPGQLAHSSMLTSLSFFRLSPSPP